MSRKLLFFGGLCGLTLSLVVHAGGAAWANEPRAGTDVAAARNAVVTESDVFVSGQGGYHTYRIPALVATPRGTLLAFCEGRKTGRSDAGNIDLLLRRSTDGGDHWSDVTVVWDDGPNTCGNPCAVVDPTTGVVWLLLTWNSGQVSEARIQSGLGTDSRRVFVTHSKDDGRTWATPQEITRAVKRPTWSWYATGPGAGIRIAHGPHRGRLVIPCDHKTGREDGNRYRSHVIFSDDHGATWQLGGTVPKDQVNECEVVELSTPPGRLLLNMRNYDRTQRARQTAISDDGGRTWQDQRYDSALIEPICQASIRRLRWPATGKPGVILFANPASTTGRKRMTVRASFDDAKTWPVARELYAGSSAYSCLDTVAPGQVACLYEKDDYQRIVLARFPLAWIALADAASARAGPAQE